MELNRLQNIYGTPSGNDFQSFSNSDSQPKAIGIATSRALSPSKAK